AEYFSVPCPRRDSAIRRPQSLPLENEKARRSTGPFLSLKRVSRSVFLLLGGRLLGCGLFGRGLLRLLVAMIVIVIVIVIVVVIMLIGIRIREQFLTADHLVGDGGQFGDEVYHLVFEDRGAQFLNGL